MCTRAGGYLISIALIFVAAPGLALAFSGAGAGTLVSPYQITTCRQLQEINNSLSSNYQLANDIDCSDTPLWNGGYGFVPIGLTFSSNYFSGTLDGQNHVVFNLYISTTTRDYVGLIGVMKGIVKNIGLTNPVIISGTSHSSSGALIGAQYNPSTTTQAYVIGGSVSGGSNTGGLIGLSSVSVVTDTYASTTVTSTGSFLGGLIGGDAFDTATSSYASGIVTENGNSIAGGLIGGDNTTGILRNVFAASIVNGGNTVGGISGRSDGATTANNYWYKYTGSPTNCLGSLSSGTFNCTSTTTLAQFQSNIYAPLSSWNFSTIWQNNGQFNNSLPSFQWQVLRPATAITAPIRGEATSSMVTLAASASGGIGTVASVTFYVDGVQQGSALVSAPYATTFDTTATSSGSHFVYSVVQDTSGAIATSSYVTFTVGNSPPTISLTLPVASSATSSTMTLAANASGIGATIAGVTFYVDNTKQGSEDTSSPYSVTFNTTATTTGPHTAFAVARDSFGHHATSTSVSFSINNSAPVISAVSTSTTASGAIINWSTDLTANSRVFFGLTSAYSTSTSISDSGGVTAHTVAISRLAACTQYHFAAISKSGANIATSTDGTFYTTGCTGSASISTSTVTGIATSTGGMLTQGSLTLTVPSAFTATSSSAIFEANQLDRTTFFAGASTPAGVRAATSAVFNLKALTDATTTLNTFMTPLTVTLSYTAADIVGLDESSLKIYRYDSGIGWAALSGCAVDTTAKTVTCNTSNFSDFAIFGTAQVTNTTTANTTTPSTGGGGMIYGSSALAPGYQVGSMLLTAGSSTSSTTPITIPNVVTYSFIRNLRQGSIGSDVKALQQYLNKHGFIVASKGPGSVGQESTYYGPATAKAVSALQLAHTQDILTPFSLSKSTGLFGVMTRAFINTH